MLYKLPKYTIVIKEFIMFHHQNGHHFTIKKTYIFVTNKSIKRLIKATEHLNSLTLKDCRIT